MIGLGRVLLARPHQILIDTDRCWTYLGGLARREEGLFERAI